MNLGLWLTLGYFYKEKFDLSLEHIQPFQSEKFLHSNR